MSRNQPRRDAFRIAGHDRLQGQGGGAACEPVGSDQGHAIDTAKRYVRLVERRSDGFVEFHFSIGDPSLFVEMLLGADAYDEFCALNAVEVLPPVEPGTDDVGDWDWTRRDAAHQRFR